MFWKGTSTCFEFSLQIHWREHSSDNDNLALTLRFQLLSHMLRTFVSNTWCSRIQCVSVSVGRKLCNGVWGRRACARASGYFVGYLCQPKLCQADRVETTPKQQNVGMRRRVELSLEPLMGHQVHMQRHGHLQQQRRQPRSICTAVSCVRRRPVLLQHLWFFLQGQSRREHVGIRVHDTRYANMFMTRTIVPLWSLESDTSITRYNDSKQ